MRSSDYSAVIRQWLKQIEEVGLSTEIFTQVFHVSQKSIFGLTLF